MKRTNSNACWRASLVMLIALHVGLGAYDVSFTYDQNGNLSQICSSAGSAIKLQYDPLSQLNQAHAVGTGLTRMEWGESGHCIHAECGLQHSDWSYDAQSRLCKAANGNMITTFEYDRENRITRVAHSTGMQVHYAYEPGGRLRSVQAAEEYGVSYDWDPVSDQLVRCQLTNGWTTHYTYDSQGQLIAVQHMDQSGVPRLILNYTYDETGRCTLSQRTSSQGDEEVRYLYDAMGQLLEAKYASGYYERYTYDSFGNRLTKETPKTHGTYRYDDENQLVQAGKASYRCDAQGNITHKSSPSETISLGFNSFCQLLSVQTDNGQVSYQYDALGCRCGKIAGEAQTLFANHLLHPRRPLVEEASSEGESVYYVIGMETVCQIRGEEALYYLYDRPNGNVIAMVDGGGDLVGEYSYTPFGEVLTAVGRPSPIGFAGGRYETGSGLILLGNRYYDPKTGRFVSRDPLPGTNRRPISWNPYLYAENDPVNHVDPFGLATLEIRVVPRGTTPIVDPGLSTEEEPKETLYGLGHGFLAVYREEAGPYVMGSRKRAGGPTDHNKYKYAAYAISHSWEVEEHVANAVVERLRQIKNYNFLTNNCVDYCTTALDTAGIDHPSFRTCFVSDTRKLARWIEECNQQQVAVNQRDAGGVCLSAVATFKDPLQDLQGVTFDPITSQLILVGSKNVHAPQMDIDDLTVAVQSIFGLGDKPPEDPSVSIDEEDTEYPGHARVRFGGVVENTHFGLTLFEADRTLKNLVYGVDNISGKAVVSSVPGYSSMVDKLRNRVFPVESYDQLRPCAEWSQRMWIEPQKVELELSEDGKSLVFSDVHMQVLSAVDRGEYPLACSLAEAFAGHFSQNFDLFAKEFPIFHDLKQLGKITAVVKWIRENRIPFDYSQFAGRSAPYVQTPSHTPLLTISYRVGFVPHDDYERLLTSEEACEQVQCATCTASLIGGVRLHLDGSNVLSRKSKAAGRFGQRVMESRPDEQAFCWAINDGTLHATAVPTCRSAKDGNVKLSAIDLAYAVRGKHPFQLQRTYNSFDDQPSALGTGWNLTPAAIRFSSHLTNVSLEEYCSKPLYGRLYVKDADGEELFTVHGFALPPLIIKYSNPSGTKQMIYSGSDDKFTLSKCDETLVFNGDGQLLRQEDQNGIVTEYLYEGQNLSQIKHETGAVIALHYQDGRPISATGFDGSEVFYFYTSDGKLDRVVDAEGNVTRYSYDQFDRLVKAYDPNGNVIVEADYDVYNRAIRWRGQGEPGAQIAYDLYAGTTRITYADGVEVERSYDSQGRLTATTKDGQREVQLAYDQGMIPASITGPQGSKTQLESTGNGKLTRIWNGQGRPIHTTYDEEGRPVAVCNKDGLWTRFAYDSRGREAQITVEEPSTGSSFVFRSHVYDEETGDLLEVIDSLGHKMQFDYDQAGHLVQQTSPTGYRLHYTYDNAGRPLSTINGAGLGTTYEYDAVGRVVAITQNGIDTDYTYDPAGNLVARETGTRKYQYAYDCDNRLVEVVDPLNQVTRYEYDARGRLIRAWFPNSSGLMREYDRSGRLTFESSRLEDLQEAA